MKKVEKKSLFARLGVVKLSLLLSMLFIFFIGVAYVREIKNAAHEIDIEVAESGGNVISAVGTNPNIYGYPETILVPFRRN